MRLVATLALVFAVAVAMPVGVVIATDAEPPPGPPQLDLSQRPFVIFSPVPPKPERVKDYPTPDGSVDYWELWEPDAPWQEAAFRW